MILKIAKPTAAQREATCNSELIGRKIAPITANAKITRDTKIIRAPRLRGAVRKGAREDKVLTLPGQQMSWS